MFYLLPPFFLQRSSKPIRFVPGLDDVRLIGQPVEHRFAQARIRKHRRPLRERQVRRHDHRRSFRSSGDNLEHHFRGSFRHRHIGHLVDHDQVIARPAVRHAIQLALVLGFDQIVHQLRRVVKRTQDSSAATDRSSWVVGCGRS